MPGPRIAASLYRLRETLPFELGVEPASLHQIEQHRGIGCAFRTAPGFAVAHRKLVERHLGGPLLFKCQVNARAFERKKPVIDRVAEEQAVDRFGDQRGDTQIAQ